MSLIINGLPKCAFNFLWTSKVDLCPIHKIILGYFLLISRKWKLKNANILSLKIIFLYKLIFITFFFSAALFQKPPPPSVVKKISLTNSEHPKISASRYKKCQYISSVYGLRFLWPLGTFEFVKSNFISFHFISFKIHFLTVRRNYKLRIPK